MQIKYIIRLIIQKKDECEQERFKKGSITPPNYQSKQNIFI